VVWEGRRSDPSPYPDCFLAGESYDPSVRDDGKSDRIKAYVENNPVKAGPVANAEDYLWSSAARKAEMNLGSAGRTACATKH